ncbi:MAG: CAAX prenyl protease-related protein [Mariniblastus sp.]
MSESETSLQGSSDPNPHDPPSNGGSASESESPLPFILPLFLFLIIASRYPDFAGSYEDSLEPGVTRETWTYLFMIGLQVLVAGGLLTYFYRIYLRHFPFRISPVSIAVGAVGVVLWIGLCELGVESRILAALGFDVSRPSFNPFTIPDDAVRWGFLVARFTLLALFVPIIEEVFLRGWFVRWFHDPSWENVSLKGLPMKTLLAASAYGVVAHPGEAIAAFAWFGLVTWLMNRTGNLWDCVVAHAVTNLLLGIYVVWFSQWQLW